MPFSEIIGQTKAVNLLSRALSGNRLAHGYLFTGPEGVGKNTTAQALAAQLFCQGTAEESPCGHCGGCIKFTSGNHPDFLSIAPDGSSIKISQIRELKKALGFPPFEAGMRIVLIEDAQTMGREAGNSLLKVLEEPPPDNLLLLIASDSDPMLNTIVSRCQVVPFIALNINQTARIIRRNRPELTPNEAESIARLTGGCPGRAESLGDTDLLSLHRECIKALLTVTGQQGQAAATEQALALAGRMTELREELEPLLDLLSFFFKEVMTAGLCNRLPDGDDVLTTARERWSLQRLFAMVDAVDSARNAMTRNSSKGLVCDVLLLELFCG